MGQISLNFERKTGPCVL